MAELQSEVLADRPVRQLPGGGLNGFEESSSDSVRGMSPSLVSRVRSISRSRSRKDRASNVHVKSSFGSFSNVRPRYGGLFESAPQEQDETRYQQQHSRGGDSRGGASNARYPKTRLNQRRPTPQHDMQQQQPNEHPSRMTSTKQQRNHLRNMLRRRKSSLIRTNSIRVSPQPGSLRGLPYDHTQINANQSPVMLVRKRSQRSLRGSPVRRFFRRLFRRKVKATYHFTKQDLKRSLSFEIRESPSRAVKYEIKSMQLLNLKPKFKRVQLPEWTKGSKTTAVKSHQQQNAVEPHMYSPAPLHAAQSSSLLRRDSGQSTNEDGFQSFDYDYRERQPSVHSNHEADEAGEDIAPLPEIAKQRTVRRPSTSDNSETLGFQRKRSIINRSHSNRSIGGPLIRRVDLYDNPNPALVLEPENEGRVRAANVDNPAEEPAQVEEALAFVETWSHYLRRAVAVRVVLRQEIHSIEAREEAEWQRKQNRRSVSSDSSAESLYSNSSSDTTATTASYRSNDSRFSDASHDEESDAKSTRDDSSSLHHGDQSSLGHTLSISTTHSEQTQSTDFAYQQAQDFREQQERIDAIKKSLEQGQIYEKYSSLVRPNASKMGPRTRVVSEFQPKSNAGSLSSASHLTSDSNLVRPKPAVRNITPLKIARPLPTIPGVAALRSVSGPAYFPQPSKSDVSTPSPLVHAIPEAPSPIISPASPGSKRSPSLRRETRSIKSSITPPPVPPKDDQYMAIARPKKSQPELYQQRNVSDQILQDMYHELEELQQRSAQLSHLVRTQRDSAIETSRRTSLASHSSLSSSSSSGADLSRGRGNRRRPRSKVYLEKRESVLDTPWTVQPRDLDDDDNSDARSEDSGVTFEGSPTHWRGSIGKHPLLIEVGDASRPPSASSRF